MYTAIQDTLFTCDHVIVVFLQQRRVAGTREVHFRGLSLERSARGAGWEGGVCVNAVFGHVLIGTCSHGLISCLTRVFTGNQGTPQGLGREIQNTGPAAF